MDALLRSPGLQLNRAGILRSGRFFYLLFWYRFNGLSFSAPRPYRGLSDAIKIKTRSYRIYLFVLNKLYFTSHLLITIKTDVK